MKNLRKKILEYTVIFEPAIEGGYVVTVPAISGCVTQGETFEDAVKNARDAIKGCLEVLKEESEDIPQEKSEVVITKISIANPIISSL